MGYRTRTVFNDPERFLTHLGFVVIWMPFLHKFLELAAFMPISKPNISMKYHQMPCPLNEISLSKMWVSILHTERKASHTLGFWQNISFCKALFIPHMRLLYWFQLQFMGHQLPQACHFFGKAKIRGGKKWPILEALKLRNIYVIFAYLRTKLNVIWK